MKNNQINDKVNNAFKRHFKKKQYGLVLLQCMTFSSVLMFFWVLISIGINCIESDMEFLAALKKIFSVGYSEFIKGFIVVTAILFFANRSRRDISGLDDKQEYNKFKKEKEPIFIQKERGEKITSILND